MAGTNAALVSTFEQTCTWEISPSQDEGVIAILCGPSGSGQSTILEKALQRLTAGTFGGAHAQFEVKLQEQQVEIT